MHIRFFIAALALTSSIGFGAETVVVFDTSTSMGGENLKVAQHECEKLIETVNIDAAHPFVLISFDTEPKPPLVFTDPAKAIAAVQALTAMGGTSIAAGLNAASDRLDQLGSGGAFVVLISDGADGNAAERDQAEVRLGSLLRERDARGLDTRMVVKRWGGSTAAMVTRLQAFSGNVVDVGESTIEALVWKADVSIVRSRRYASNDFQAIEMEICLTDDVFAKDREVIVLCERSTFTPNQMKMSSGETKNFRIDLPISDADEVAGEQELVVNFLVGEGMDLLDSVTMLVPLAALRPIATLACEIISAGYQKWTSPETGQLRGFVDIEVEVAATSPSSEGMPIQLDWEPTGGLRIASHHPRKLNLRVGDTRVLHVPFDSQLGASSPAITIKGIDESSPERAEIGKEEISLTSIPLPPAAKTPVTVTVEGVDDPVWTDLRKRKIQSVIRCDLFVDGPILGENNKLVYSGPWLALGQERTFASGRQALPLYIEMTAGDDGDDRELPIHLSILAEENEAIVLEVTQDVIHATVPAPDPVELVLLDEDGNRVTSFATRSNSDFANFVLRPMLDGPLTEEAFLGAGPVSVRVSGQAMQHPMETIAMSVPITRPRSFWFESSETISIEFSMVDVGHVVSDHSVDVIITRGSLLSLWIGRYSLWIFGVGCIVVCIGAAYLVFRKEKADEISFDFPFNSEVRSRGR